MVPIKRTLCLLLTLMVWGHLPPVAQADERPNILVISLDTLRPDHLSLYGYRRETAPNLSRLAKEAMVFTQAYSTSSWTLPAHASFFTGLQPREHGLINFRRKIRDDVSMITEELTKAGYQCAAFVNATPLQPEYGFARGFSLYDNYSAKLAFRQEDLFRLDSGVHSPKETITSPVITRSARHWLRTGARPPFFLFVHYFDIHDAYIPPGKYRTLFDPDYEGPASGHVPDKPDANLSQRDREHLVALYDGEIAWVDHHFGMLLEELEMQGLRESTIIVLFSDHGEGFGEHGLYLHGNSVYEELMRMALLISWPARYPQPVKCDSPVSLLQLHEALRSVAGLPKANSKLPTLFEVIANNNEADSEVVAGSLDADKKADFVRKGEWKLILTKDAGECELYNLVHDPREKHNLAEIQPEKVDELLNHMKLQLPAGDEEAQGLLPQAELTAEEVATLRALGYM